MKPAEEKRLAKHMTLRTRNPADFRYVDAYLVRASNGVVVVELYGLDREWRLPMDVVDGLYGLLHSLPGNLVVIGVARSSLRGPLSARRRKTVKALQKYLDMEYEEIETRAVK